MARHADALAADGRDPHAGRFGMSVGARVGRIEQAHHSQIQFARLQHPGDQLIGGRIGGGEEIERLVEGGIDIGVFVIENPRVVGVCRRALQTVEDQLLQAGDIQAEAHLPLRDRHLFTLAHEAGDISGGRPGCRSREGLRRGRTAAASVFVQGFGPIAHGGRVRQVAAQPFGIEIDVGDRGEEEGEDRSIDLIVTGPQLGCPMGVHRDAFRRIYQEVLQRGRGGVFAANAKGRAAASSTGLLTLIAVHRDRAPWWKV